MSEADTGKWEQQEGVGPYLRACREAKGISLDDAAQVTRISKSYLDALEREDYDRLPGPAYCKGFLRIYAGYLGLSGDAVVARYDQAVAPPKSKQPPKNEQTRTAVADGPARRNRKRWLLPLVLFMLVLVLALFFNNDRDTEHRPVPITQQLPPPVVQQPPVQPVRSSAATTPGAVTPPLPAATIETPIATPPTPPQTGETANQGVILSLKANQDSWVNVDIDGRISQQYDLKAGDLIEWKAERVINLDVGNAGGVEADLNGKHLPPLGPAGKSVHLVLGSSGPISR